MPMYEFICGACESDFEKIVPNAEAVHTVECPSCGSKNVHKKLSLFGVAATKSSTGSSPFGGYSGGCGCGGSCSCH